MDPIAEEAIHQERHIKIACIGAGVSGLLLAYKIQRSFKNFTLDVFEKNNDIGGTWHENVYPGCCSDIPAHNYTYSFEPKHDWSSVYAPATEIKNYTQSFATNHDLHKFIKLNRKVIKLEWRDSEGLWDVETLNTISNENDSAQYHIVVKATGYLNHWKLPDIPGGDGFSGKIVHSANYPQNLDLGGKKVVLIGNGASAVQILPQIQPIAESVTTIFRSPSWFVPDTGGGGQQAYTIDEIAKFKDNPEELLRLRKTKEAASNSMSSLFRSDSILQSQVKGMLRGYMQNALQDEELQTKLIPPFAVGCQRLGQGTQYLKALSCENVKAVNASVASYYEHGCRIQDGTEYVADVIICATGFDMSFKPPFPVLGEEGRNLQHEWSRTPTTYMGVATANFPNFFMILGPYSPLASGSLIPSIETQVNYVLGWIDRFQTEKIHKFSPKPEAEREFITHVAQYMTGSVYDTKCSNEHNNHNVDSRTPTVWPGSTLHYIEAMRDMRAEDWNVVYSGNRFAWLGNGFSQQEFDATCDLAWYMGMKDTSPYHSRWRRRELLTRTGSQPPRELHRPFRPQVYNI